MRAHVRPLARSSDRALYSRRSRPEVFQLFPFPFFFFSPLFESSSTTTPIKIVDSPFPPQLVRFAMFSRSRCELLYRDFNVSEIDTFILSSFYKLNKSIKRFLDAVLQKVTLHKYYRYKLHNL